MSVQLSVVESDRWLFAGLGLEVRDQWGYLDEGILLDPGSGGTLEGLLPVAELDGLPRGVVLLGEGGIGKSRILRALLEKEGSSGAFGIVDPVDMRRVPLSEIRTVSAWRRAEAGERTSLYLDHLDEVLGPSEAQSLAGLLERAPPTLSVRLACRDGLLTRVARDALTELGHEGPPSLVARVLPLTRAQVWAELELAGLDAASILSEVERLELAPLAANPFHLTGLVGELVGHRGVPQGAGALLEQRLEATVWPDGESAPNGAGLLTEDLELLDRAAAFTLLCGRPAVVDRPRPRSHAVSLDQIFAGRAFEAVRFREVRARCGLLSSGEGGMWRWEHSCWEEYLAARFLHRSGIVEPAQVANLLVGAAGSRIDPRLRGLVRRLAELAPSAMDALAFRDPVELPPGAPGQMRLQAARSALNDLAEEGWSPWIELPLNSLAVLDADGLDEILRPALRGSALPVASRRFAADVAWACRRPGLLPELVELALDSSCDSSIRLSAAHGVARFGGAGEATRLRPLLDADSSSKPAAALRGAALRAIWQTGDCTLIDALEGLDSSSDRVTTYRHFGGHGFASALDSEATRVGLDWCAERWGPGRRDSLFGGPEDAFLARAWELWDDEDVRERLVQTVRRRVRRSEPMWFPDPHLNPGRTSAVHRDTGRRHLLLGAVVPLVSAEVAHSFEVSGGLRRLCFPGDFVFLLGRAASTRSDLEREVWVDAARAVYRSDVPTERRALESLQVDPLVGGALRGWVAVDDERRVGEHEQDGESVEPRLLAACEVVLAASDDEQVAVAWRRVDDLLLLLAAEEVEGGDPQWWVPEVERLTPNLDESTRTRLVSAAAHYLRTSSETNLPPPGWAGDWSRAWGATLRALSLIEPRDGERDRLSVRWSTVVLAPEPVTETGSEAFIAELRDRVCGLSPATVVASAGDLLDALDEPSWAHGVLRAVEGRVDFAGLVIDRWEVVSGSTADVLINALAREDPARAASELSRYLPAALADQRRRREAATILAAVCVTNGGWQHLELLANQEDEVVPLVARELVDRGWMSRLEPGQMAMLFGWLRAWLQGPDPDRDGIRPYGPWSMAGMGMHVIRETLGSLEAEEAVLALADLRRRFPEDQLLTRAWWSAAGFGNSIIEPEELHAFFLDPARRIIHTDADLLRVVLDALDRIARELSIDAPRRLSRFLWDEAAGRPKPETALSDWLARELRRHLPEMIVLREVEVGPKDPGNRTDIQVELSELGLRLVIECKWCNWGPADHRKAIREQLVGSYLADVGTAFGIYLVGFPLFDGWRDRPLEAELQRWNRRTSRRWTSTVAAEKLLRSWIEEEVPAGTTVRGLVLACPWKPQRRHARGGHDD